MVRYDFRPSRPAALTVAAMLTQVACCKCNGSTSQQSAPTVAAPRGDGDGAPSVLVVENVVVKVVGGDPERELFPELLGKRIGQMLVESPWFASSARSPGGAGLPVIVEVQLEYSVGRPALLARVAARVVDATRRSRVLLRENVQAERVVDAAALGDSGRIAGLLAEHVKVVVEAATRGLVVKAGVHSGRRDQLSAALASSDADLLLFTLEIIRERKYGAFFDQVLALIEFPDQEVKEAAVGTLVGLGDQRAVAGLADRADYNDLRFMVILVEGVARLGGRDAAEFLHFLATGHEHPEIRRRAAEALARLRSSPGETTVTGAQR